MARIYKREGKNGPVWYLDYQADDKRIRRRIGKSRELAQRALAKVKTGPIVILPLREYEALLAEAGRIPPKARQKRAGNLKAG